MSLDKRAERRMAKRLADLERRVSAHARSTQLPFSTVPGLDADGNAIDIPITETVTEGKQLLIDVGQTGGVVTDLQDRLHDLQGTTLPALSEAVQEAKDAAVAAAVLRIDSSKGSVFKNNTISTVLSVTIYYATQVITNITDLHAALGYTAYLEWFWRREDDETFHVVSSADNRLSRAGFALTVSPDDVDEKTVFQCVLHA